MRRLIYALVIFVLVGGITLTAYAPDEISMVFIILMELLIGTGVLIGIFPLIQYYRAFDTGMANIEHAMEVQTNSTWAVIVQIEEFFHQKFMDQQFKDYQEKVQSQRASGLILSDINEYISEEILGNNSWQNIMLQIPGMLTSLGILGTFLGLIIGIRGIGFSSVNAALSSVQSLLSGIQVAFYTSIAGVILSLVFNITYRISWNVMVRNLGLFLDEFHKNVIPSTEEQIRYRERKEIKKIIELLERLPKSGQFSVSGGAVPAQAQNSSNEQILMPQILQGLRDGEFIFFLQPRFDLNSQKVIGAEALVRWKHGKLGMVSPAVFIPILESNGYITKLDQYIWEKVCTTIRHWIDTNIRPVPISINVTKTDVLAIDIVDFFNDMMKKYRIPPRYLEVEIAQNAYMQASNVVLETESKLRQSGFRVVMDGFNGDFIQLHSIPKVDADLLKLDLRRLQGNVNQGSLNLIFEQARNMNVSLGAEGIENMEQMNMLRKCGCAEGQGFFLSKPISLEEFESVIAEGEVKRSELPGQSGRQDEIPAGETPDDGNGAGASEKQQQQSDQSGQDSAVSDSSPETSNAEEKVQPASQTQNLQNDAAQTGNQSPVPVDQRNPQEQQSTNPQGSNMTMPQQSAQQIPDTQHGNGNQMQQPISQTQVPQGRETQVQQQIPQYQQGNYSIPGQQAQTPQDLYGAQSQQAVQYPQGGYGSSSQQVMLQYPQGGYGVPDQQAMPQYPQGGYGVPGQQPAQYPQVGYGASGQQAMPQYLQGGYGTQVQQPIPQYPQGGYGTPGQQAMPQYLQGGYGMQGQQPAQYPQGGYAAPDQQLNLQYSQGGHVPLGQQPMMQYPQGGYGVQSPQTVQQNSHLNRRGQPDMQYAEYVGDPGQHSRRSRHAEAAGIHSGPIYPAADDGLTRRRHRNE